MRPAHAKACGNHAHGQQAGFQAEGAQQQDKGTAQGIGGRDHRIGIAPVHCPAHHNGAHRAADLEQPGNGCGTLDGQSAITQQGRHPAHGQVDHQQAHEIGQPQGQRAEAILLGEQHAHWRLMLHLGFGHDKPGGGGEGTAQLVQHLGNLAGRSIVCGQKACGFGQQQPQERQ